MKKRIIDSDYFYPSELEQYKKHLKHGKSKRDKAYEKAENKAIRRNSKAECFVD